jgi:hypothetical protein
MLLALAALNPISQQCGAVKEFVNQRPEKTRTNKTISTRPNPPLG